MGFPVILQLDTLSWTSQDLGDENESAREFVYVAADTKVSPLTLEEIRVEQQDDKFCKATRRKIEGGNSKHFVEDERGLLVRIASVDRAHQIVCPEALRQKVLFLAHYAKLPGTRESRRCITPCGSLLAIYGRRCSPVRDSMSSLFSRESSASRSRGAP